MRRLLALALSVSASAFASLLSPYSTSYTQVDLGAAPSGVPANYGGLLVMPGDPYTLLLGGAANGPSGAIYSVGLTRDAGGHIDGFTGTASLFSTAPYIDGGLAFAPNGVLLYARYPSNQIGEIKPGSTSPNKVVNSPSQPSLGTLAFVPGGFNGAGNFVLGSYSAGGFCTSTLTPDGAGTYDVAGCAGTVFTYGGPEGIIWVPPGSPLFSSQSVLVSQYGFGTISAYTIGADGLPDPTSQTGFYSGLTGVEGATLDPQTGDFLFSTFGGGNHIIEIRGFAPVAPIPEPAAVFLILGGVSGLLLRKRFYC